MPKENLRSILKSRTRILSQAQNEASAEHNREKDNQMSSPILEDKERDRPRIKHSTRKPFTCRVAVFEEGGDTNKKPMYPKHLVYAGGKDIQLEEIRAMHYWNKVKGTGIDMCTQTEPEPEPTKVIPMTETCTQTESESSSTSTNEIGIQTDPSESNEQLKHNSPKVFTSKIAVQTDPPESNEQPKHSSPKVFTSRITTRSSARARAASKIPAATSTLKNVIKEEPAALNSATFIIPKDKKQAAANSKKGAQVQVAEKLPTAQNSEDADEDDDLTYNTKAFKVIPSSTPSSTPFQVLKNKNKGRRRTIKIDTP